MDGDTALPPAARTAVNRLHRRVHRHYERAELVSLAWLALAQHPGDPGDGYWVAMGGVGRALSAANPVPANWRRQRKKLEAARHRAEQRLLRAPTSAELAAEAGVSVPALHAARRRTEAARSVELDAPHWSRERGLAHRPDPLAALARREALGRVATAADALPAATRDAWRAVRVDGANRHEAAAALRTHRLRIGRLVRDGDAAVREAMGLTGRRPSLSDAAYLRERLPEVERALGRVPPRAADAWRAHRLAGRTQRAVAATLNVHRTMVTHLCRLADGAVARVLFRAGWEA